MRDRIEELNNYNNNFDPYIIKDLFIDFFDDDLIEHIEINKLYKKENSIKTIKGVTKPANYINYVITINFKLNNQYSDKFYRIRKRYLEERDNIRDIIYYHYGHKSLNYGLSQWNLYDTEKVNGDNFFKRNEDYFDLWSKSLWL